MGHHGVREKILPMLRISIDLEAWVHLDCPESESIPISYTILDLFPMYIYYRCIHPSICPADGDDDDADDEGEDDYSATIKFIFIIFLCFLATVFPLFVYIL